MFYLIKDNVLKQWGDYKFDSECLELASVTMNEYNQHPNKYIVNNGKLITNPNYEQEEEEKERQRILHLCCTKRVLALTLQQLGISYIALKQLIDSNEQAQLEWDLCVELERNNPLLDTIGAELGLTSTDIDNIFKYANGEITAIEREVINE